MGVIWLDQLVVQWVDSGGRDWSTYHTLQDQSGFSLSPFNAFLSALQGASDAKIERVLLSRVSPYSGTIGAGPYDSVREQALLQCMSDAHRQIRLRIPGPKAGLFEGDNETVNLGSSLVVAVQTEAAGVVADLSGAPLETIRRGSRVQVMP